jgi:radical SAM superfamily enzyme YgiQ (UPF0313 family)
MRILLVSPEFPPTYWGLQHGLKAAGKKASLPPLGLITLAALLPQDWEYRLIDMNIEPLLDEDLLWSDAVLVGGMLIQGPSMRYALRRAKALGRRTVVGGPAPTTAPEAFEEADVVFGGEAEGREAELVDLIRPNAARTSRSLIPLRKERPDVKTSPIPRFDLLRLEAYISMAIQISRGCPFNCEFCDIIEIFGRVPRMKSAPQVIAELDALRTLGWRGSLFIVDDNFIGNIKEVRKLLPPIAEWQEAHGKPLELYTEASVNLAADDKLVAGMVAAGFTSVFLGIETPSEASLRETQKTQNLRAPLDEAVLKLTRAGLEVMGGFIVGFDADDASAFDAQRNFLQDAPIPMAMVGLLTALPGTQLWRRLEKEERLREARDEVSGEQMERPNFVPAMDEGVLLRGYAKLIRELYSIDGFLRRCEAYLATAPTPLEGHPMRPGAWRTFLRTIWLLGIKSPRRRLFWSLLNRAGRRSLGHMYWAVVKSIQGEHFIRFTDEVVLPRLERAIAEVETETAQRPRIRIAAPPLMVAGKLRQAH